MPEMWSKKSARSKQKKIIMIDPNTKNTIREFDSITDASKELGINASNISMVCKGKRKKAGGYIWRYQIGEEMASSIKDSMKE